MSLYISTFKFSSAANTFYYLSYSHPIVSQCLVISHVRIPTMLLLSSYFELSESTPLGKS